jgi:exodeoxyribonuclease V gamma subunit
VTLSVHVADHPDVLVGLLCDLLAKPLDDPFAPELVAVPTRGIERWLTQRIASELGLRGAGDGVCANVRFPSPHDLVHGVLQSVPDLAASAEAWHRPALVAALVEAIDAHVDQPWMRLVARHLDGPGGARAAHPDRLSVARKAARLFDGYARRRPTMIGAWAAGRFVDPDGGLLSEDSVWQARLFGAVRERIGVPSLPEVLSEGLGPVRSGAVDLDLPPRLGIYGLTAVDPLDLDVLEAVATHREVHLFVLHPSPALWRSCAQRVEPGRRELPRGEDTTAALPNHAILRS